MKTLEIRCGNSGIQYDKDYGVDKRKGWSVYIDLSFCAEFEKYLITALCKAFYEYWFVWDQTK